MHYVTSSFHTTSCPLLLIRPSDSRIQGGQRSQGRIFRHQPWDEIRLRSAAEVWGFMLETHVGVLEKRRREDKERQGELLHVNNSISRLSLNDQESRSLRGMCLSPVFCISTFPLFFHSPLAGGTTWHIMEYLTDCETAGLQPCHPTPPHPSPHQSGAAQSLCLLPFCSEVHLTLSALALHYFNNSAPAP